MELGWRMREDSTRRKQRKKEKDLRRSQHLGPENASDHFKVDICRLSLYVCTSYDRTLGLLIWYSDTDLAPIYSFVIFCISLTNPSFQLISRSESSDRIGTSEYRKMYKDRASKSKKASYLGCWPVTVTGCDEKLWPTPMGSPQS